MFDLEPEVPARDAVAIERLFDATFGPGHFAKTAERLREFNASLPDVSRVLRKGNQVIAVCRVWPIRVGGQSALFFGPVAVAPEEQGQGLGQAVTKASMQAAGDQGHTLGVLIGDPALFTRVGFVPIEVGSVQFDGPQDQKRVMMVWLDGRDAPFPAGKITAPRDAMRAETEQRAFLQRARAAGDLSSQNL